MTRGGGCSEAARAARGVAAREGAELAAQARRTRESRGADPRPAAAHGAVAAPPASALTHARARRPHGGSGDACTHGAHAGRTAAPRKGRRRRAPEPTASMTEADTKFSDGMSSRPCVEAGRCGAAACVQGAGHRRRAGDLRGSQLQTLLQRGGSKSTLMLVDSRRVGHAGARLAAGGAAVCRTVRRAAPSPPPSTRARPAPSTRLVLPVLLVLDDVRQLGVHLRQRRVQHLGPLQRKEKQSAQDWAAGSAGGGGATRRRMGRGCAKARAAAAGGHQRRTSAPGAAAAGAGGPAGLRSRCSAARRW